MREPAKISAPGSTGADLYKQQTPWTYTLLYILDISKAVFYFVG